MSAAATHAPNGKSLRKAISSSQQGKLVLPQDRDPVGILEGPDRDVLFLQAK